MQSSLSRAIEAGKPLTRPDTIVHADAIESWAVEFKLSRTDG